MDATDRLGRRRRPRQTRGLRSLFPRLPEDCRSRLVRIAMRSASWERFEAIRCEWDAPSAPRAYGAAIEWLLERAEPGMCPAEPAAQTPDQVSDWQRWQIRKERMILDSRGGADGARLGAAWN